MFVLDGRVFNFLNTHSIKPITNQFYRNRLVSTKEVKSNILKTYFTKTMGAPLMRQSAVLLSIISLTVMIDDDGMLKPTVWLRTPLPILGVGHHVSICHK